MRQVPIYYINLASRPDRRTFMEEQFERIGLEADRIEATTPIDLAAKDVAEFCQVSRPAHVSKAELSCTMSHVGIWQMMADQLIPWVLILEDDVVLSARLKECVSGVAMPAGLDIIRVETRLLSVALDAPDRTLIEGIRLCRPVSHNPGSGAYFVSLHGARMLLKKLRDIPVDDMIYQADRPSWLRIRQAVPGLAVNVHHIAEMSDARIRTTDIGPDGGATRRAASKARGKVFALVDRLQRITFASTRAKISRRRGGSNGIVPFAGEIPNGVALTP